jgi:insulysin
VERFTPDQVAAWSSPEMVAGLRYPAPNPFIPDELELLGNDPRTEPYLLIDDERGLFWFEQDKTFRLPKARVSLLLLSDDINQSPRNRVLATLYVRAITESLNEWNYPVLEAGLSASVDDDARGIRLRFNGYSQRIPALMRSFAARLDEITIEENAFAAIRDELAREFQNNAFDQSFWQTFYEYNWIKSPRAIHRKTYMDLVQEITLDEVKAFAATVLDRASIEGVGYGNLDPDALRASIDDVFDDVSDGVLPEADRMPVVEEIDIPDGKAFAHVVTSKNDNHCWLGLVQLGERSPRREAIARVGAAAIETPFYSEMRTNQQLGYAVFSGASLSGDAHWIYFCIQSGDYSATELRTRAHAWMDEAIPGLAEMSDEQFDALKASVVTALRQKDTDMAERLTTIAYEALTLGGEFDHDEVVIREVESLTRDEVAQAFAAAMSTETGTRLAIYHDAVDAERSVPEEPVIEDPAAWKRSLPTFQPKLASLAP